MPLEIALRTSSKNSYFKEFLYRLLAATGDSLILSSGYFSQVMTRATNVLDHDGLESRLITACASGRIILIGGMFTFSPASWKQQFRDFARRLRVSGATVETYEAKPKRWHAKIAMRLANGKPIAAIVGSSNMTAPAFTAPPTSGRWNYEADVLLWGSDADILPQQIPLDNNGSFVISAQLAEAVAQPDENARLITLYEAIMNQVQTFD